MDQNISTAAQILVALIPIVGIVCGSAVMFFALLWRHRETKQRIINNTYKPVTFNFRVFSLLTGLFLTSVGLVLSVMFIILHGISWAALGGLIPLASGISMLIFYKINPDFSNTKGNED